MALNNSATIEMRVKQYFDATMQQRKAEVPFEAFSSASVFIDGNKIHIDVIEVGKDKPTLVFIPGTALYGLAFADFLFALSRFGINIVSLDPRGHGQSGGESGFYSIGDIVRDARSAISFARNKFNSQVFLAGSSQGGIAAFYTAATDEKLAGVICHNIADLSDPMYAKLTDYNALTIFMLSKILKPFMAGLLFLSPKASVNISLYYSLLARGKNATKERLLSDPLSLKKISIRALHSLLSEPMASRVEKITTPMLIVHGEDDRIFTRRRIDYLYGRLNCDKIYRIYPGRGHFLFKASSVEVLEDISNWIELKLNTEAPPVL